MPAPYDLKPSLTSAIGGSRKRPFVCKMLTKCCISLWTVAVHCADHTFVPELLRMSQFFFASESAVVVGRLRANTQLRRREDAVVVGRLRANTQQKS